MPAPPQKFTAFDRLGVKGFLHPAPEQANALALTHGAGGNCEAPLLVAVAEAFQAAGLAVLRFDLPFRQRRPRGPPGPGDAAKDRAGIRAAAEALREVGHGAVVLGGLSYGARQTTMLASEQPGLAQALMLLSYPLHPPGTPDQKRTAHFPKLETPALFVHGTGDPFGSIPEMEAATLAIPPPHRLLAVEGAGHDLKRGEFDLSSVVREMLALAREGQA